MKIAALAAFAGMFLAAALGGFPAFAQDAVPAEELRALRSELETLKRGQALILKELEALRGALAADPEASAGTAPSDSKQVTLDLTGAPFLGDADAPITLIEFSDYQCPYCRRHSLTALPALKERYVATGKIKYVMQEFPIESIHPFAFKASEAALCAGEQDAYWAMHDRIFDNPKRLRQRDLLRHAEALGLDVDDLEECLEEDRFAAQIRKSLALGTSLGVRGTPSFFVAITDRQDPRKAEAIQFIRGAVPLGEFTRAIDAALAHAGQS